MKKLFPIVIALTFFFPVLSYADCSMTAYTTTTINPADATTYRLPIATQAINTMTTSAVTTANTQVDPVPCSGIVDLVTARWRSSANTTSETFSVYLYDVNTGLNSLLSSTWSVPGTSQLYFSWPADLQVTAGDVLYLQFTTPTWATNPTSVSLFLGLHISQPISVQATVSTPDYATSSTGALLVQNDNMAPFMFFGVFMTGVLTVLYLFGKRN